MGPHLHTLGCSTWVYRFSYLDWPLSFCRLGQRQISHSHNDSATIPGQISVLHLKAYLTFHSSIHGLCALRLWARPRLAFGRQCSELKATHGPALVLWATKHTSRARNSWPVFLTHKEKLGIGQKYVAMDLGSKPDRTKVLEDRTRQMVFFLVNFRTSTVRGLGMSKTLGHMVKRWNIWILMLLRCLSSTIVY